MAGRDVSDTTAAVEAVVFDVGHVLYDWNPRHLYAKLIAEEEQLEWFLANVVTYEWHYQHDAGRPFAETSVELIGRFPEHEALIAAYGPRWLETVGEPIEGMIDLVGELASAGMPLFAITNFSDEFFPRFRAGAPVFSHFRDVVVSGAERMIKPERRIFELAVRRFGIEPRRSLFVDDRPDNVEAAEALGFIGHVFRDAATLRRHMQELGIELAGQPAAAER
jgi:2-haloacid dehalogenase